MTSSGGRSRIWLNNIPTTLVCEWHQTWLGGSEKSGDECLACYQLPMRSQQSHRRQQSAALRLLRSTHKMSQPPLYPPWQWQLPTCGPCTGMHDATRTSEESYVHRQHRDIVDNAAFGILILA
jgi:hypothetical protein